MGYEYHLAFAEPAWYPANRERLAGWVRALPRVVADFPGIELRLKDATVPNPWSYDLRLFLLPDRVALEVSGRTATYRVDVRDMLDWIRRETPVTLIDDDTDEVAM